MNFRLAYEPRARLPTVNPQWRNKWSAKTGFMFKIRAFESVPPPEPRNVAVALNWDDFKKLVPSCRSKPQRW
jgi:hypothetical protein